MTEVELLAITLARGRPPAKKDGLARKKKIKNKGHEKDLLQKNLLGEFCQNKYEA